MLDFAQPLNLMFLSVTIIHSMYWESELCIIPKTFTVYCSTWN